ncbi:hypothetical protein [Streptomyces chryseus]|uniref:Uncharacterized protein n=1 Tax=Streptomyces chryseus TaxID=68186 RepID=A0ABQ3DGW4_9ACTN|nr:hypothetical protein [Streptomyces chryseus]GHA83299.1 hypothetical protein GCM10010346_02040 [Streptomyces chryseus]
MRHTLAGPEARANYPGWFWAAGTHTARHCAASTPGGLTAEAMMPSLPAPRPAAAYAGLLVAGGA